MAIIVLEGIDASAKKTQARRLQQAITKSGDMRAISIFDFPHYDSLTGPFLKALLKDDVVLHHRVSPAVVNLGMMKAVLIQALQSMNRYEFSPMLEEHHGKILILDRYFASALAYGPEDGLSEEVLTNIHIPLQKPDLSILINLSAEESMRRRPIREDAYEADVEFLQRVSERYKKLFKNARKRFGGQWKVVDGMGTEDEVAKRIFNAYSEWEDSQTC